MEPVAAALPPVEMRQLALYYASLQAPAAPPPPQEITQAITRGQAIAVTVSRGNASHRVSTVTALVPPAATRSIPCSLASMLTISFYNLSSSKKGSVAVRAYAHLMRPVATRLTPQQMRDVALYYESLPVTVNLP